MDGSFTHFFVRKSDDARLTIRYIEKTGEVTRTYTQLAGFENPTVLDDVPPDYAPLAWAEHLIDCVVYSGWRSLGTSDPDGFTSDIIEMSQVEDVFSS